MTTVKNLNGDEVVLPPRDEEEILLEKLVFGDLEGFETNLKKIENLYDYSSDEDEQEQGNSDKFFRSSDEEGDDDDNSDLENVQDDDLFFIDEGADQTKTNDEDAMEVDGQDLEEDYENESDNAWEDSDDERLNISLTSSDRLKKLRKHEADSSISGKSYIIRLRSQFEKIYPKPEWVEKLKDEADSEDSDIEVDEDETSGNKAENDTNAILKILSTTQEFITSKQAKLIAPNKISITRLKDANQAKRSKSAVQSLSFHTSHPLLLTGGFDRTMRVYHIDGKVNNLVTSLHLRNSPITTCHFSNLDNSNQNLIFAGGRRRYMTKWDLNTGEVEKITRMYGQEQVQRSMEYFKLSAKGTFIGLTGGSGWCNILNGSTGQYIKGFKIEGTIIDFEFTKDELAIFIINTSGEIWEYALSQNSINNNNNNNSNNNNSINKHNKTKSTHQGKILRRWQDDGAIGITKIKLGGASDRWLAIGNNNGLVNLYDRNSFTDDKTPKPFKTVGNLVTTISDLTFSPDGQILCISSRAKRDALRLVHLPSGSVYSNWPTSGTPLGRVTATAFTPNNEMLAVGNESGKVTLWRLNHY